MKKILLSAIERSRTTFSLLAVILIVGIGSRMTIPVEAGPDVSIPVILVTVPHEGISPKDADAVKKIYLNPGISQRLRDMRTARERTLLSR